MKESKLNPKREQNKCVKHESFSWSAATAFAVSLGAQDPAKVAANQCKVEFENDYVRVLRWKVGPGAKTPMHEHPASISILLSGGHVEFTLPDGTIRDLEMEAGQVTWNGPESHASQNVGETLNEVIQIELKGAARP